MNHYPAPAVDRTATTDRLEPVRPRTRPMPAVPTGRATGPLSRPAAVGMPSGATDRNLRLQKAADALHGHLAYAASRKWITDAHLAAKLDRLGVWPVLPIDALTAALAPVLADARTWWAALPDPRPCQHCDLPDEGDLCESHKRGRYAWLDVLDRLAVRVVDEVPTRARETTRRTT